MRLVLNQKASFMHFVRSASFFLSLLFLLTMFYSCSGTLGVLQMEEKVDPSLPVVSGFKVLPDVSSVGFEWDLPKDTTAIAGYVIYRSRAGDPKSFDRVAVVSNPIATHYYDSGLSPTTSYTYSVSSLGTNGSVSPKGKMVTVKTSFIDPVDFVHASDGYVGQVKLIWSPIVNPAVKRYIIQKKVDGKFLNIGTVQNRMYVEYFDSNLESGVVNTYRVVGESYDGALSVYSREVKGSTRGLPSSVSNVKATTSLPKSIKVTWDSIDVAGYKVFYADNPGDRFKELGSTNKAFYVDNLGLDGKKRYYKVVAVDSYGLEGALGDDKVEGSTLRPPYAPNITSANVSPNGAVITWVAIDEGRTLKYVVHRKKGVFGSTNKYVDLSSNSFTDKDTEPDASYTYYVTSVDSNGIESAPSNEVTLKIGVPSKVGDSSHGVELPNGSVPVKK